MKTFTKILLIGVLFYIGTSSCKKEENTNPVSNLHSCTCVTTVTDMNGNVLSTSMNTFETEDACSTGFSNSSSNGATVSIFCK